jgi:zinc and cadmium transporter
VQRKITIGVVFRMSVPLWIIGSSLLISSIAFIGMVVLFLKDELLAEILLILVAFSAGSLMGGAFLHLLPETIEKSTEIEVFLWLLGGFILFFFVEKVLQWHHCHRVEHFLTLGYMNLFGDAIHNFSDGLIIAASFIARVPLGVVTTLAIALHEIPQEIGDFGVLVYSGFSKIKALLLNLLAALTIVLGGITGYFISGYVEEFTVFLLPLAAGGFLYIASSDLIPEIRKETDLKKGFLSFVVFLFGVLFMYVIRFV